VASSLRVRPATGQPGCSRVSESDPLPDRLLKCDQGRKDGDALSKLWNLLNVLVQVLHGPVCDAVGAFARKLVRIATPRAYAVTNAALGVCA